MEASGGGANKGASRRKKNRLNWNDQLILRLFLSLRKSKGRGTRERGCKTNGWEEGGREREGRKIFTFIKRLRIKHALYIVCPCSINRRTRVPSHPQPPRSFLAQRYTCGQVCARLYFVFPPFQYFLLRDTQIVNP